MVPVHRSFSTSTNYLYTIRFPSESSFAYHDIYSIPLHYSTIIQSTELPYTNITDRRCSGDLCPTQIHFTTPPVYIYSTSSQESTTAPRHRYRVKVPDDRKWGNVNADGTVTGMVGEVAARRVHLAIDEISITGK